MLTRQQEREAEAELFLRQLEQEIADLKADLDRATRAWWKETWNADDLVEIDQLRVRAGLDPISTHDEIGLRRLGVANELNRQAAEARAAHPQPTTPVVAGEGVGLPLPERSPCDWCGEENLRCPHCGVITCNARCPLCHVQLRGGDHGTPD